jgi:hypothetical protein
MSALQRLFDRLVHADTRTDLRSLRDWCCRSCADAWLAARLAEAERVGQRTKRGPGLRERVPDSW